MYGFSEVMADIQHEARGIHRGRSLVSCGQADAGGVFLHFHADDASEADAVHHVGAGVVSRIDSRYPYPGFGFRVSGRSDDAEVEFRFDGPAAGGLVVLAQGDAKWHLPDVVAFAVCIEDGSQGVAAAEAVGLEVGVPYSQMGGDVQRTGPDTVFSLDAGRPHFGVDVGFQFAAEVLGEVLFDFVVSFHVTDVRHDIDVPVVPAAIEVDAVGVVVVFAVVVVSVAVAVAFADG